MERKIHRNGSSRPRALRKVRTFGDLIDLHVQDMHEVGKPPRRSKAAVMEALKGGLGTVRLPQPNRERLIEFGRKRAKQGACRRRALHNSTGPATRTSGRPRMACNPARDGFLQAPERAERTDGRAMLRRG